VEVSIQVSFSMVGLRTKVLVLLAAGTATDATKSSSTSRAALSADDACDATSAERCAVSHLQISSRDASAASARKESKAGPVAPEDDIEQNTWVVDDRDVKSIESSMILGDETERQQFHGSDNLTKLGMATLGGIIKFVDYCGKWVNYYWPKVSFLALEFRRRVKLLPDDMSPEQRTKLRDFRMFIAWWMCEAELDPRNGTKYSGPVARSMATLASLPSTSFEVPKMDAWFGQLNATEKAGLNAFGMCMEWTSAMVCDIGYLAESLGSKSGNPDDICWDKVQHPLYPYAPLTTRAVSVPGLEFYDNHTEYKACQEGQLTKQVLHDWCPWHGKMPKGVFGISWGEEPDHDSEMYKDIMQCQHKTGLPPEEFPMCADEDVCDIVDMGLV